MAPQPACVTGPRHGSSPSDHDAHGPAPFAVRADAFRPRARPPAGEKCGDHRPAIGADRSGSHATRNRPAHGRRSPWKSPECGYSRAGHNGPQEFGMIGPIAQRWIPPAVAHARRLSPETAHRARTLRIPFRILRGGDRSFNQGQIVGSGFHVAARLQKMNESQPQPRPTIAHLRHPATKAGSRRRKRT